MFSQTAKAWERLWICSLDCKIGKDIQPIQTSQGDVSRVAGGLVVADADNTGLPGITAAAQHQGRGDKDQCK